MTGPSQQQFSEHLHTKFRVKVDTPKPIELELAEVKGYLSQDHEQSGLERFSIFFTGPPDVLLPQCSYALMHESLGNLEIFLVPIGVDEKGFRYEAVFNYSK